MRSCHIWILPSIPDSSSSPFFPNLPALFLFLIYLQLQYLLSVLPSAWNSTHFALGMTDCLCCFKSHLDHTFQCALSCAPSLQAFNFLHSISVIMNASFGLRFIATLPMNDLGKLCNQLSPQYPNLKMEIFFLRPITVCQVLC